MKKTNEKVAEFQGNSNTGEQPITPDNVAKWIKRDLGFAIQLLDAIYRDADITNIIADAMYQRHLNRENAKAVQKEHQDEIPGK